MKQKPSAAAPPSFHEFVAGFADQLVRVSLSNGERREGILVMHDDYVTFDEQAGGLALAHIASIVPLATERADVPASKRAKRAP